MGPRSLLSDATVEGSPQRLDLGLESFDLRRRLPEKGDGVGLILADQPGEALRPSPERLRDRAPRDRPGRLLPPAADGRPEPDHPDAESLRQFGQAVPLR